MSMSMQVGCVCNNAQLKGDQIIGHPTEGAILALGHKLNLFNLRDQFMRLEERTFTSEQKWMGVLVRPLVQEKSEVSRHSKLLPQISHPACTCTYIYMYVHVHV